MKVPCSHPCTFVKLKAVRLCEISEIEDTQGSPHYNKEIFNSIHSVLLDYANGGHGNRNHGSDTFKNPKACTPMPLDTCGKSSFYPLKGWNNETAHIVKIQRSEEQGAESYRSC